MIWTLSLFRHIFAVILIPLFNFKHWHVHDCLTSAPISIRFTWIGLQIDISLNIIHTNILHFRIHSNADGFRFFSSLFYRRIKSICKLRNVKVSFRSWELKLISIAAWKLFEYRRKNNPKCRNHWHSPNWILILTWNMSNASSAKHQMPMVWSNLSAISRSTRILCILSIIIYSCVAFAVNDCIIIFN